MGRVELEIGGMCITKTINDPKMTNIYNLAKAIVLSIRAMDKLTDCSRTVEKLVLEMLKEEKNDSNFDSCG